MAEQAPQVLGFAGLFFFCGASPGDAGFWQAAASGRARRQCPCYRQSLFARGAHDRESARLARRVSVPVPASAPVPREARSAVVDHHRTAACMRDRRLNESTGTHGGPRRGAARRGAVAIAQRRSSNPAVRRASIESRCARHIVLAWIDCTARACSRAGTIDRRMVQYANVARDARNERNLATCIGRRASPRSCNSCVIWPRGARIRRRCRNGSAWRRERCWR
ncbi:hypothetical protein TR70_1110 [Burkholderia pseudomallei]|nr:hypothetical protein TR70_1110 [Burkholderia pseudomallei]